MANFFCWPQSYLKRARKCLNENENRFLFYAALELRFFVESRQNEYLIAQEKYRNSLPKSWKVGQQAKELSGIFESDSVQYLTSQYEDGYEMNMFYVPVFLELSNGIEKLGQFLHSAPAGYSDLQLREFREHLMRLLNLAEVCGTGNLLTPLLMDKNSDNPVGAIQAIVTAKDREALKKRIGQPCTLIVEYLAYEDIKLKLDV